MRSLSTARLNVIPNDHDASDCHPHTPEFALDHILGDSLTAHRVALDLDLMLNVPDSGFRIHLGSMPSLFRYKRPPARYWKGNDFSHG
jgi:hypothetical protein